MNNSIFFNKIYSLSILLFVGFDSGSAQILINSDFESGGSFVGFFVRIYKLINPVNGTTNPEFYTRTINPILMDSSIIFSGDHTTGTGNILVIDGSVCTNQFFWTTGNTGGTLDGFTAGTTHTFSYWIKSVSNQVTSNLAIRSNIGAFFVNASIINPPALTILAPLPLQGCEKVSFSFITTANNILIRLQTLNAGSVVNNFAVDDLSITQNGLPFAGSYTAINPSCPNATNRSIKVNLTGITLPYGTYTLSNSAAQTNAYGIFSALIEGAFSVSVVDASGEVYSQTNIVIVTPNNIVLSNPITICQGSSTLLSATRATSNYTWTANPSDSSISNQNTTIKNVSLSFTIIYTISSSVDSFTTNLIMNGNFSLGNIGFSTEYSQIANPKIIPDFTVINPICAGGIVTTISTTFLNKCIGTWSPILNNLVTSTYTFTATLGQCALSTSKTIIVHPLPGFSITQGCNSFNHTVAAEESSLSDSTYQLLHASNNSIGTNASVQVFTPDIYKLIIIKNGCNTEKIVPVITPFCSIQKDISPNDDGENDTFDLARCNVNNLQIFNRFGTVVYEKSGYENKRYGKSYRGNKLPNGTYYNKFDFADSNTKTG